VSYQVSGNNVATTFVDTDTLQTAVFIDFDLAQNNVARFIAGATFRTVYGLLTEFFETHTFAPAL